MYNWLLIWTLGYFLSSIWNDLHLSLHDPAEFSLHVSESSSLETFLTYWKQEMLVQTFIYYKTYLLLLMKGPTNSNINNTYAIIPYLVYIEVDQLEEVRIVFRDSMNLGCFRLSYYLVILLNKLTTPIVFFFVRLQMQREQCEKNSDSLNLCHHWIKSLKPRFE